MLGKERQQLDYREEKLFELVGMRNEELGAWLERLPEVVVYEEEKRQEYEKIRKSLSTTTETIDIFQHIEQKIQT